MAAVVALVATSSPPAARGNWEIAATKALEAGQNPNPAPGDRVVFVISLKNIGDAAVDDIMFSDDFDPCFEALGAANAHCDPALVSCAGPGCGGCIYTPTGFNDSTLTLAADDGAPGGADEIDFRVVLRAGSKVGTCTNTATPCPPGSCTIHASATVTITDPPAGCNLLYADVALAPLMPPRIGGWVYGHACTPENTLPAANVSQAGVSGDELLPDLVTGSAGTLRLYDLSCGCSGRLGIVKDATVAPARVHLWFF